MEEINGSKIGTLNGVSFDIGATKLCKVVKTENGQYSLILKISLNSNGKIVENPDKISPLVLVDLAPEEDIKSLENNIHGTGIPDVHFIVRGGLVYLNIEVPVTAKKQTTGD